MPTTRLLLRVLATTFLFFCASGDALLSNELICSPPAVERYYSVDGTFRVKIRPAKQGTDLDGHATAEFGAHRWWGYKSLRKFQLLNPVAPARVLVSQDGTRIVTLGNWCSEGFETNLVAIYDNEGALLKSYSREDLITPGDIQELFEPGPFVFWWWRDHRMDPVHQTIFLNIGDSASGKHFELPLDLATGKLLERKRDHLSKGYRRVVASILEGSRPDGTMPKEWVCSEAEGPGEMRILQIPSKEAITTALELPPPKCPGFLRLIKAFGKVVIEVRIAPDGHVQCVRPLAGKAQLQIVARDGAKCWRFPPIPLGTTRETILTIDFHEEALPYRESENNLER
jgi:hypothetical protein